MRGSILSDPCLSPQFPFVTRCVHACFSGAEHPTCHNVYTASDVPSSFDGVHTHKRPNVDSCFLSYVRVLQLVAHVFPPHIKPLPAHTVALIRRNNKHCAADVPHWTS